MAETPKRVWSNKKIVRQGKKQVWLKNDELKTYGKSWEEIDADKPLEVYGNEWKGLDGSDELEVYGNSEEEIGTVDDYTGGGDKVKATFKNWNGTVLKTQRVEPGETPTAPANPTRPADEQYTYTFTGWEPAVGPITENTEYVAQYSANGLTIDTSSMSMLVGGTGTRSFTYTPANADFSGITINSTFPDVATATLVKDSDGNGHVEVTAVSQLGGGTTIEITYLGVTQSFYVSVEVPIQVQSISNIVLPRGDLIVPEGGSVTFTFDYLPVNANDFSNVTFEESDECYESPRTSASVTSYSNGTATVTVQGLNYSTSNDPELLIYLDGVQQGEDKTMQVRPYAEVVVAPGGAGTVTLSKPLYIPYGGTLSFNGFGQTSANPSTVEIYDGDVKVDTLTITATPEDGYKFTQFEGAIGSSGYRPDDSRAGINCDFTLLP